jgi:hypothetical protein
MKLIEMKSVATDTLAFFVRIMPDTPFTVDDIVIEFALSAKMAERAHALCAQYSPEKTINESQALELNRTITANALIGKEKSAIIARNDYKRSEQEWREIFFHELMHIFCAKLEVDGEHFVDVYGSGTTPENPNMTAAEKTYDGFLVAGHIVWSEFIAQYYTWKHTETQHPTVSQVSGYINDLLYSVGRIDANGSKYALSFACARLLTCTDTEETISMLNEPDDEMPIEQQAFLSCLILLYEHLQAEKPWKISEEFIADLGIRYLSFLAENLQLVKPQNHEMGDHTKR